MKQIRSNARPGPRKGYTHLGTYEDLQLGLALELADSGEQREALLVPDGLERVDRYDHVAARAALLRLEVDSSGWDSSDMVHRMISALKGLQQLYPHDPLIKKNLDALVQR